MESSRTMSFIRFSYSFVPHKEKVEKGNKSQVHFSERWYLSVIGKLHLNSKSASPHEGTENEILCQFTVLLPARIPNIFPLG